MGDDPVGSLLRNDQTRSNAVNLHLPVPSLLKYTFGLHGRVNDHDRTKYHPLTWSVTCQTDPPFR
jgi:hypothetical protein